MEEERKLLLAVVNCGTKELKDADGLAHNLA